ncbi:mycofactocin biosynthesis glycosyltransferase MftF [Streptomyces sp. NPDC004237]|uniref:mycofactocin biosynthesis glycosyltransferase MftF n=1 Tax=Streptomyces sp. NPDC004237 TaxID=3154455 RepID=UPI0033AEF773
MKRDVRRLADGFAVRLRDDVRFRDGLLVGGSPLRAVRVRPAARKLFDDRAVRVAGAASDRLAGYLLDANLADPVLDHPPAPAGSLTVVVPVRDRVAQLGRCLAALAGLDVLVVDDASEDVDAVTAVVARHGATLVPLPTNLGPAGARNAGLKHVTTPYVAFVDSDVVVSPDALLRLTRHFQDAKLALVGPLVRGRSHTRHTADTPRWFERYDEAASSLALGTRPGSVQPGANIGWLPSACLVGRTKALRRLGLPGFDPAMRIGEDVDLVWRLLDAGWKVRYDPSEAADHDTRATLRGWLGRKVAYGTGGAPLAARHGRSVAPAVLSGTGAAVAAAVLVRKPWSVPVAVIGLGHSWWRLSRRLPETDGRAALAGRLTVQGTAWAVRQEAGLLLRHWWPLTAVLCPFSRTVRRAASTALVVDLVVAGFEHPGAPYQLAGRRLDDLAYGAGLWLGALRARSIDCLLPRRPRG